MGRPMGSGQKSQILMVNIYVDMEHVRLQVALFYFIFFATLHINSIGWSFAGATWCFSGIKNAITKPHTRHHNHEFNPSYKNVAS